MTAAIVDEIYRFNLWANSRVLALAKGLKDSQLDAEQPIGFGSLRSTLFHILAAEEIWLERWEGRPWRPFEFSPLGAGLEVIQDRLTQVHERRQQFLDQDRATGWSRRFDYLDSAQKTYSATLIESLMHVANHGMWHRAQALHFLKGLGRTIPVGLDYLVYKLAYPSIPQPPDTAEVLKQYGLELQTGTGVDFACNLALIHDLYAFHDWALEVLIERCRGLEPDVFSRDWSMGPGSLLTTLRHLFQVDSYWLGNWTRNQNQSLTVDDSSDLESLVEQWQSVVLARNQFLGDMTESDGGGVVETAVAGPPMQFRLLETLLHVPFHGTHHRAQLVNMLKRSGIQSPALDYSIWSRQRGAIG